jgi:hypothetical protein
LFFSFKGDNILKPTLFLKAIFQDVFNYFFTNFVKNQSKMHNTSTILIEVLLKTIDKMGIKKTIQVLQISQSLTDENKKVINLIIANTCKHFQISEDNLKHGRGKINRTNALV